MTETDVRQAAVHEKRQWVRLTRGCNNHCLFCLDSGAQTGRVVPVEEVRQRIVKGREQGANRLILSGGEPTIHPKFHDIIRFGAEAGYSWIQTVTNGRMFRYRKFTSGAVDAGLREATISIHGHTADLHDRLVNSNGAFLESITGLRRLQALDTVVSVDIVLNRINLPYLREILEFFMGLGVMEFDLLHMIPFGRGFEKYRDELFADDKLLKDELGRALELASTPGLFIWTNRLPIHYLEGREELFQDPHKIYDEVLGERDAFKALFESGREPDCLGDACPHCFLKPFCDAARIYAFQDWTGPLPEGIEATPDFCKRALADPDIVDGPLLAPTTELLGEAEEVTPEPDVLRELHRTTGRPIHGLPPCLYGPEDDDNRWPKPPDDLFGPDGSLLLDRFVGFFNERLYRVKSLRCRQCMHDDNCAGLHVNTARIWGLSSLKPIKPATSDN